MSLIFGVFSFVWQVFAVVAFVAWVVDGRSEDLLPVLALLALVLGQLYALRSEVEKA